jgi:hypothetical protein
MIEQQLPTELLRTRRVAFVAMLDEDRANLLLKKLNAWVVRAHGSACHQCRQNSCHGHPGNAKTAKGAKGAKNSVLYSFANSALFAPLR